MVLYIQVRRVHRHALLRAAQEERPHFHAARDSPRYHAHVRLVWSEILTWYALLLLAFFVLSMTSFAFLFSAINHVLSYSIMNEYSEQSKLNSE